MPIELGSFSLGSVAGTIVGCIAGHYLTKVRDKEGRDIKDFNEVAGALADKLRKERSNPDVSSSIDFFAFRRVLSENELICFDRCLEEYKNAKENSAIALYDEGNIYVRTSDSYQDPSLVIAAIDELLKMTNRK